MNTRASSPERFPVPVPDGDTQPFWDAAASRRLVVPCCEGCGTWIWQPKPVCPRCHRPDPGWRSVSGDGRVRSWTVLHPPVLPAFASLVPFVIVLVELADAPGVRMVGQLVDGAGRLLRTDGRDRGLAIGKAVSLRWRDQGDVRLPAWTLSGS